MADNAWGVAHPLSQIGKPKSSMVVFNCLTSKLEELVDFLPSFKSQVTAFEKYQAYVIDK
jgi:hypothetical protein